jgi:hypothetical protein
MAVIAESGACIEHGRFRLVEQVVHQTLSMKQDCSCLLV